MTKKELREFLEGSKAEFDAIVSKSDATNQELNQKMEKFLNSI